VVSPAPKKAATTISRMNPKDPAQHRGETYDAAALATFVFSRLLVVFMLHDDLLTVPSLFLSLWNDPLDVIDCSSGYGDPLVFDL